MSGLPFLNFYSMPVVLVFTNVNELGFNPLVPSVLNIGRLTKILISI